MARPPVKAVTAAQLIRKRILHGDHVLHGLASERVLAKAFGISRETLRSALRLLENEGILERQPNGRLTVAANSLNAVSRGIIGFVKHSNPSHDHQLWSEAVRAATEGQSCTLRTITFEHYGDSSIAAALDGLDGAFFLPPAGELPEWLADRIRQSECKVVVLDQDATHYNIPSVVMFPPHAERKLLDHLRAFGHKRIDCLNTQARDAVIEARIETWREYIAEHKLKGQLHSLTEFRPLNSAYQLIRNRLFEGRSLGTAMICTTGPAAIGAMRAFYEEGVKVGRDISICSVNDEGLGPYLIPSLTCLQTPTRSGYLEAAAQWMLDQEVDWQWPLLVQPDDVPMFEGASTGPAPDAATLQNLMSPGRSAPPAIPETAESDSRR